MEAERRDGVVTAASSAPTPTLTVAAVARRLGVAPPTLRTWDRRYGLGPSAHTAGAHRRYSPADVARLMVMRRLTLEGVSPADAAKIAVATPVTDDGRPMHTPADGLSFDELDSEPIGSFGLEPSFGSEARSDQARPDAEAWPEPEPEPNPRPEPAAGEFDEEPFSAESPSSTVVSPPMEDDDSSWPAGAPEDDPEADQWSGVLRSVGSDRGTPGGGRVVAMPDATPQSRGLARAAMSLDTYEMHRILRDAVRRQGVVSAWDFLIMPVLRAIGERTRVTGDGIDVEHAFSEVILGVMRSVAFGLQPPRGPVTVMLACADSEYHSLPLHALAAALAEREIPSRMLGSGLPVSALSASVRRTGPSVIVLFARMTGADAGETEALRRQRPTPTVILAGPGWDPQTVPSTARTASSLVEALDEVLLAIHA
jgi:hypothetical protein